MFVTSNTDSSNMASILQQTDPQLLKHIKAQRAAALEREVSLLAQGPYPSMHASVNMLSQGNPCLGGLAPALGQQHFAKQFSSAWEAGAMRRHQLQHAARPTPYARMPARPAPVSRTDSNVSSSRTVTSDVASSSGGMHPPGSSPRLLAATDDVDAAAGLLSLSPLNSPALSKCIDLLATPDLIGIAGDRVPIPKAPLPLWQPAGSKRSLDSNAPPTPRASSGLANGAMAMARMSRQPERNTPMTQPLAKPSCPSPTCSPTPLTQQVIGSWEPTSMMHVGSPLLGTPLLGTPLVGTPLLGSPLVGSPLVRSPKYEAEVTPDLPHRLPMAAPKPGERPAHSVTSYGTMMSSSEGPRPEASVGATLGLMRRTPSLSCMDLLAHKR